MARLAYYSTTLKADVLFTRDHLLRAYDRYPDTTLFWAFLDLVDSSNFRLVRGPKEGYVRAESFYTLVNSAIAPYEQIRRVKELGDGVLLAADSVRPLFESCVLIGRTARELGEVAGAEAYPFAMRMAIGYGPAKRLGGREADDFVGSAIDITARLVSAAEPNQLVIHEHAYGPSAEVLSEYESFATYQGPTQLSAEQSKNMASPVLFYRVSVDDDAASVSEENFAVWQKRDKPDPLDGD